MTEELTKDQIWDQVEEITKDFDFAKVKETLGKLPEDDRKVFDSVSNIRGLLSQHQHSQKRIGELSTKGSSLPALDSEDAVKLWDHIGVGKTADDYQLGVESGDLDENIQKTIKQAFLENKIPTKAGKAIMDTFLKITTDDVTAKKAAAEAAAKKLEEDKVVKFGDKLSEIQNLANTFISKQPEAVQESLKSLAKTPDGLEYLSKLGQVATGDNPAGPAEKQPSGSTKTAAEQIADIKAGSDPVFAAKLFGGVIPGEKRKASPAEQKEARARWKTLQERAAKGE